MNDLVLIVDDTPQNLQVLGQTLRQESYEVAMAMNGNEALEFLNGKELPQLILLDVMMPGMSGYEVCEEIKKNKKLKNIPVIFITAKSETEDIVKGFDIGGVDYVTKPFQPAELLARVRTHIALKKSREEVFRLQGMLPVCANCHNVRDDKGYWKTIDQYMHETQIIPLSHSICPNCLKKLYPELVEDILGDDK